MPLIEGLLLYLAPAIGKATLKLWLSDRPLLQAAGDGIVDLLRKRGENYATIDATDRLFRNLTSEVAERLQRTIEIEFPNLAESDVDAAIRAVAGVLGSVDLSSAVLRSDLESKGLERVVRESAGDVISSLGGDASALAGLVLRESCAYVVAIAGKLPDFQVASTRELLKRTSQLTEELTRVMDVVTAMRSRADGDAEAANFETQYRRAVSRRLDRMQLFGVRFVGAGAREPEISVAYVTLTSTRDGGKSVDVDSAMSGLTRIVVRGEAGSGKTTLLQWLAIRAAGRDFSSSLTAWNERLPFYLTLREHSRGEFPPPERFVASIAPNLVGMMPSGWAHSRLKAGALVLIDGVDEVPAASRPALFEWLRGLIGDFPESVFVMSSRPAALDAAMARSTARDDLARIGFQQIALEPMSIADSEALISQWHQAVSRDLVDSAIQERLEWYERELIRVLRDKPAVRSLVSNPLLCSMICVLNWDRQQRLPDNRMELYGLALDTLIDARDAERRIQAARLDELDRQAKITLLDGIAYWMMLNGETEASRPDVETQVAVLLKRLSRVPSGANEVLQELLERSGVIRQPQAGVVDFIHRTFLEFMAARAAIQSNDLGVLANKARDDAWRETIVFAVGHAAGRTRDHLVSKLLKTPFFSLKGRSLEADVTAACCLETASHDLDPELLLQLRRCATNLFPPKLVEVARILAPAAALQPDLLSGHVTAGEEAVAACIRCAAIVGGETMLRIIESYASVPGDKVWEELVAAWTAFDANVYFERIVRLRADQCIGKLRLADLDPEALLYFRLAVSKGSRSAEALEMDIRDFVESHEVRLGDETYGETVAGEIAKKMERRVRRVTERDAKRLAELSSTRGLALGTCEAGVLPAVAQLPHLCRLKCSPMNYGDLASLSICLELSELAVTGLSIHSNSRQICDLRPLNSLGELRVLEVTHIAGEGFLPRSTGIRSLRLAYVPDSVVSQIIQYSSQLLSLHLQLAAIHGQLDLSAFDNLREIDLYVERFSSPLRLPASIKELRIQTAVVNLEDCGRLTELTHISLNDVKELNFADALFSSDHLTSVFLNRVSSEVKAIVRQFGERCGFQVYDA